MIPFFDLIVVIPVGPNVKTEFIIDTIASVIFNTSRTYKIILLDDSQIGTGKKIQRRFPEIDLLHTEKNYGSMCGLYISLSIAYRHAMENYQFSALLKLDTDALIIGQNPEEEAIQLFKSDPSMGMAGQYPTEYDGRPWDIEWPRRRILNGTSTWKYFRRPFANNLLIKFYKKALKNGYITGESVFGGAYFMSWLFLNSMLKAGLLPNYKMRTLNLGEDHLFSLLVMALGFKLGDLSSGQLPFGCAWQGLPDAPDQLVKKGKKIIHSTRFWNNMKEEEIRTYFSNLRVQADINQQLN